MRHEARREGERRARVRDEVQLDLVAADEVAVHRDDAQDLVGHRAARGDAHGFVFASGSGSWRPPPTSRFGSRTRSRRSAAVPSMARRIFCVTVSSAICAWSGKNFSRTFSSPSSSTSCVSSLRGDLGGLRELLGLLEQHVVEGRLLRRLGDELVLDRGRGFLEGGDAELDAVAHGELDQAVGRGHAHGLVHVELLDDRRVLQHQLFVGRDDLAAAFVGGDRPGARARPASCGACRAGRARRRGCCGCASASCSVTEPGQVRRERAGEDRRRELRERRARGFGERRVADPREHGDHGDDVARLQSRAERRAPPSCGAAAARPRRAPSARAPEGG